MAKVVSGPYLPNIKDIIAAGINPKTGLPIKMGDTACSLKEDIKKIMRIIDEQDAVNRYTWYNLPCELTSQELERMLYYKGQLCFFYIEELDQFYFMPYALDGTIDFYGRFNSIHPVPMASGGTEDDNPAVKAQRDYLSTLNLKCVYGIKMDVKEEDFTKCTVLLHDYSKQLSQTIIPRQIIQDPLLTVIAECVPFMRTSLIASSGIKGVRVNDADQALSVKDGSRSLLTAALVGDPWVPILGQVDFQELTDGQTIKAEEFMLSMQSLDNLRLSAYGIDNGGLFEKKAHILQAEAAINGGPVGLVLQDGLTIRQNFCNIVNSIWGLGIWCEISEPLVQKDMDMDGKPYESDDDGMNTGMEGGSEYDSDDSTI